MLLEAGEVTNCDFVDGMRGADFPTSLAERDFPPLRTISVFLPTLPTWHLTLPSDCQPLL